MRSNRGTSLLEVITAFSVLIAGVLLFTGVIIRNFDHTKLLNQKQRALQVMENEIERLRGRAFNEIPVGERMPLLASQEELEQINAPIGWKTITALSPDLVQVLVRLDWSSPDQRVIKETLTTLIARPGGASP